MGMNGIKSVGITNHLGANKAFGWNVLVCFVYRPAIQSAVGEWPIEFHRPMEHAEVLVSAAGKITSGCQGTQRGIDFPVQRSLGKLHRIDF